MKRLLFSGIIVALAAVSIQAQEKIILRLPLGLSPGISRDSTSMALSSLNAIPVRGREGIYKLEFSFGHIPMKKAIPVYLKSELLAVAMYSDRIESKEIHIARLKEAFEYIAGYYDCEIVEEKFTGGKFTADLDDGIELASFTSKDFSLFLDSGFESGKGYILSIHIYTLPLTLPAPLK